MHLLILNLQANAYYPNWGQIIFQSAREMDQNTLFRTRIDDYQSKAEEERQWWDRKKASIQEGFMKELDEEKNASAATSAAPATTSKTFESATATTTATGVSDDDGVLVESEIPSVSSGTNSVKKKKKGKK